jgi:hypothetical protein
LTFRLGVLPTGPQSLDCRFATDVPSPIGAAIERELSAAAQIRLAPPCWANATKWKISDVTRNAPAKISLFSVERLLPQDEYHYLVLFEIEPRI